MRRADESALDSPLLTLDSAMTRQTLSYLRSLLESYGISPKSKLGQNFLIDLNLIDLIVRTAELTRDDLAIEVGSRHRRSDGPALRPGRRRAVGRNRSGLSCAWCRKSSVPRPNLTLVRADILKNKNELNPEVLAAAGGAAAVLGMPAFEAGRQPAVCRGHAGDRQLPDDRAAVRAHGGDGAVGDRREADRPAGPQGIRRPGGAGAEPGGRRDHPQAAAERVLSAAQGGIGHRLHPAQCREAGPGRRRAALGGRSSATSTRIAARTCAAPWPAGPAAVGARKRSTASSRSWASTADSAPKTWTWTTTCACARRSASVFAACGLALAGGEEVFSNRRRTRSRKRRPIRSAFRSRTPRSPTTSTAARRAARRGFSWGRWD